MGAESESPRSPYALEKLGRAIHEQAASALNGFGTLFISVGAGLAVGGALRDGAFIAAFGLAMYVRSLILGSSAAREVKRDLEAARKEASRLRLQADAGENYRSEAIALSEDLWKAQLALIFQEAKLGTSERLSLYSFSAAGLNSDGEFRLLSRYSTNPAHMEKGRIAYPPDEGCLSKAWREESYFLALPDPESHLDEYYARQIELGLTLDVARQIKMKSREYFGFRIDHGEERSPVAVVMFESIAAGRLDEIRLGRLMGKQKHLARLIKFTQATRPDLDHSRANQY